MGDTRAPGLRSLGRSFARSPKVRAAASFPFRLGPAGSDWWARPFAGLATVNNLSGAGDALVTVALAGSVFVSVSLHAARGRTALGLLCTVLPFAVVGPFVGPVIDRLRGGRRFIVFLAAIGRLAACLLMASWIHSLLLFPAAFLSLVCSKTHAVAKAALVPGVVDRQDDLVRANSRLAVGGAVVTSVAAGIGGLIYKLFGSRILLDLDVLVFATCAGLSMYLLPTTMGPRSDAPSAGRSECARRRDRGAKLSGSQRPPEPPVAARSLRLACVAMAGMRAVAGFLTALVVFAFRRDGAPLIWYGLVGLASVGGNFGGALMAPRLRLRVSERLLVASAAVMITVVAVGVSFLSALHRRPAAIILALAVALGASLAKTAFDAIVQRHTLDRDRSRLFARFESIFQLAWVGGALVPTLIPTSLLVGYLLAAVIVASTSWVFVSGLAGRRGVGGAGPAESRVSDGPWPARAPDAPSGGAAGD